MATRKASVATRKTNNHSTTNNDKAWNYGKLTVDDIIDCALRLIGREGVAKLTMRRLADELGMSSMITYYYVKSKNEMLDLILERIWQDIPRPGPETGDWQERLRVLSLAMREALIKYPGLVQVIQSRPLAASLRDLAQFANQLLIGAGMDEALVHDVDFALYHYSFGAIAWEVQAVAGGADPNEMLARYATGLDVVLEGMAVAMASSRFRSQRRQPQRRSARKT